MKTWLKMEMFTGRIVETPTDWRCVTSSAEAKSKNDELIKSGSRCRWVTSLAELARFEEEARA